MGDPVVAIQIPIGWAQIVELAGIGVGLASVWTTIIVSHTRIATRLDDFRQMATDHLERIDARQAEVNGAVAANAEAIIAISSRCDERGRICGLLRGTGSAREPTDRN